MVSVSGGAVFGGSHNQALRLSEPLKALGWRTVVVVPDEPGTALSRLTGHMPVHAVRLRRFRRTFRPRPQFEAVMGMRSDLVALRELIRAERAEVVQVHGPTNPQPAIAGRRAGAGVVWQLLDTRAPMPIRIACMPLVRGLADVAMSTGEIVADLHPGARSFGSRLVPYYPPVDVSEFTPDWERRARIRRELGIRDETVVIGTVGNRNPQKGHDALIRAFATANSGSPKVQLRIWGAESPTHPDYEAHIQRLVRGAGLPSLTIAAVEPPFTVADVLLALDVFVLASVPNSEGVPTVILEAMASGVPVVAADVGGVREVVLDGTTGIVCASNDVALLAAAIEALVEAPHTRIAMGAAGRNRVVGEFSLERCAAVHAHAYELAAHSSQRRKRIG